MKKTFFIFSSFFILCLILAALYVYLAFFSFPLTSQKTSLHFIIPSGASIQQITNILENQGVKSYTRYFLWLAQKTGYIKKIKSGEYEIASNATLEQLVKKLAKGQVVLHKITFPEGWTFKQFIDALNAHAKLTHTINYQNNTQIMASIGQPNAYPEGSFYPDTYLFTINTKDTQILKQAYNLMQKKLQQAWEARALNLPYKTPEEALIIASLIEKETAVPSERPMIAAVILNRLKIGMRLQIDAAVLYGLPDKTNRVLTKSELATDTPYNTYTRAGLPPTPIAMPSLSSIQAALHPATTSALYYVAKGDGTHVFSYTLKAHHVAVQDYRTGRVGKARHPVEDLSMGPIPIYVPTDQAPFFHQPTQCFSAILLQNFWLNTE